MIDTLAWVTAGRIARGDDPDEAPAVAALRRAGIAVDVVDWDDASAVWSTYDRVVLRSPWDYVLRLEPFLAWLGAVDAVSDLRNPLDMVRWSLDKHYLADLAAAGLPVVPTVFVEPGQVLAPPDADVVVKPAVGAGSSGVRVHRHHRPDDARAHVEQLHAAGRTALLQPLLTSVALDGEFPLVFLGGHFSHGVRRHVTIAPDGAGHAEHSSPHRPDSAYLALATAVMEHVTGRFGPSTYARIDLVADDAGHPRVLEVELAEPSLFLPEGGPGAVERLASALTS